MSALVLSIAIGTLLGLNGRAFSWTIGGLLIAATTLAGLLFAGISPPTLIVAVTVILGYNFGLTAAIIVLLQKEAAV